MDSRRSSENQMENKSFLSVGSNFAENTMTGNNEGSPLRTMPDEIRRCHTASKNAANFEILNDI